MNDPKILNQKNTSVKMVRIPVMYIMTGSFIPRTFAVSILNKKKETQRIK
jgi:hypothetical protein